MPVTTSLLLTDDLSVDPETAFHEMVERVEEVRRSEEGLAAAEYEIAIAVVTRFAEKNGIDLEIGTSRNLNDRFSFLSQQIREIGAQAAVDKFTAARTMAMPLAVLSRQEKSEILSRVESIRKLIEASDLTVKKKNVLYKKLSDFAAEVSKDGTNSDTFFALAGETFLYSSLMGEKAKPALEEIKDILRIIFGNRAKREDLPLPSSNDILRFPSKSDE